jgi:hypothetical protein
LFAFLSLVDSVAVEVFLRGLSSNFFDSFAIKVDWRIESVWHGITTFECFFVLLVVPVPVGALLTPLIAAFLIVIFFSIAIFFLFIFAVLIALFLFSATFSFRLTLLYDLSLLIFLSISSGLFGLFWLLRLLFFLFLVLLVIVVVSATFFTFSVNCASLSKCLTRQVFAELCNDWVTRKAS